MGSFKRKAGWIGSLLLAIAITVVPKYWELSINSIPPLIPPPPINTLPNTEVVEDTIQKNRTLVATLVDYDVPAAIAHEVADLIKPVFDLRKLRDTKVPDVNGKTLPPEATHGQVHWSIHEPHNWLLIGRVEQADLTKGLSMTASCTPE